MSFDPLTAIFDLGKSAIERKWPDPIKRAEELRKLEELRQRGDIAALNAHVQLMVAQLEVNKAEAQHKSMFVAGWRPAIGWIGAIALGYQFILYPLMLWLPIENPPVQMGSEMLYTIITGMLGVAGMRSFDKKQGTQTDRLKG